MKKKIVSMTMVVIAATLYYQGYTWSSYFIINFLADTFGPDVFQDRAFEMSRGSLMFVLTFVVVFISMVLVTYVSRRRNEYLPISLTILGTGYFFFRPVVSSDESIGYGLMLLATNIQTFIVFLALLVSPTLAYLLMVKVIFKLPEEITDELVLDQYANNRWK